MQCNVKRMDLLHLKNSAIILCLELRFGLNSYRYIWQKSGELKIVMHNSIYTETACYNQGVVVAAKVSISVQIST